MKVLVIGQFLEPPFSEGVVNTVLNWSKAVHYAGANVSILSISSKYSGYHKIFDMDFEYIQTKNPRFQGNLTDWFALQREIVNQSREFDIIHYASNADGISSVPMLTMLKLNKNKTVNSYHTDHLAKSTSLIRNLLFNMVTVPSKRMFNSFMRKKVSSQKMRIIPPCVDTELFRPRNKFEAREKLSLPEDSFLIFTTGHFKGGRRLFPLIHTINKLASKHENIGLLIGWTGHGEADSVKESFSIARKMEFVRIIPPTSRINLYYNAADVYILSASSDYVIETPMSIIEALSSGTPVITFDINAASEIIRNDINGYLIKNGNFNEMKLKLSHLMDNMHLSKEFSMNARNLALNNFSYNVVGEQLYNLYRELIDNQ